MSKKTDTRHQRAPYKCHFVSEQEQINVSLNQVPVTIELNTGASLFVINKDTYNHINTVATTPITKSPVKLKTYLGESIPIISSINVHVKYKEVVEELPLHVVDGNGPNLIERNWLSKCRVNLGDIFILDTPSALKEVLKRHSSVFTEQLGCLRGVKVKLSVNSGACPKFFKPRPVPFALREKVEAELERLVACNVISPVQF